MPANLTKLQYLVWQPAELNPGETMQQMKGKLSMAEYRFRINAERLGIDSGSISTQIEWTGELECRFTIGAPVAPEVPLSSAWQKAAELIGLRTEQVTAAEV